MVALTGIEPAECQFSSVQLGISSFVFDPVQFATMAFRAVRMADVLPRCCPAARMRLLRSVILLRAQSNLRRLPQDFKGERHAVIAKHLPSQSGQEWVDFEEVPGPSAMKRGTWLCFNRPSAAGWMTT